MAKRPTTRSKITTPADPAQPATTQTEARSVPRRLRTRRADKAGSLPAWSRASTTSGSRAYERYLERGGNHGQHFDDWLEAEKELRSKK